MDWNTGLEYWTEFFSFFGQVSVFILAYIPSLNYITMNYEVL